MIEKYPALAGDALEQRFSNGGLLAHSVLRELSGHMGLALLISNGYIKRH